jgi:hypothetical protein
MAYRSYSKSQPSYYNNNTQVVSANTLAGLANDDEDNDIYDRRCYESDRRMTDSDSY